ncbi:hypothetical protein [Geothrix sp. 21YS21S-2]|uniref:hypothetical protein n=1 Tax=Geothrix sp. 21YS21S-2 TaxID=3068893 RepID=UPI0027B91812|nr:hypothetical protein [Geothrix sp. 21YS21S-2]
MENLWIYIVKTYGLVLSIALVIAYAAYKGFEKYLVYAGEVKKIKLGNELELAKIDRSAELKAMEEAKIEERRMQKIHYDISRHYQEVLDQIYNNVKSYWQIEKSQDDPKYAIGNIRQRTQELITFSRMQMIHLGPEFVDMMEKYLLEVESIINIPWNDGYRTGVGQYYRPSIAFTEKDRQRPLDILKMLMEKANYLG